MFGKGSAPLTALPFRVLLCPENILFVAGVYSTGMNESRKADLAGKVEKCQRDFSENLLSHIFGEVMARFIVINY